VSLPSITLDHHHHHHQKNWNWRNWRARTFVSTVSTAYPGTTAEFMAYMACIVRCHKDYEGPAWVLYDRAFRRRAEMTKDLYWSVVNTLLFNLCFGGRARRSGICKLCLSEHHTTERCPRRVLAWGSTLAYSAAIDGGRFAPVPQQPYPIPAQPTVELCRLFNARNGNRCRFPNCRFAHICSKCRALGHGAGQCGTQGSSGGAGGKRPRLA
jgi:hypothetical protein